jgi:hypothetical protein
MIQSNLNTTQNEIPSMLLPKIHKRSKSEHKENKCHSHSFCGNVDEI